VSELLETVTVWDDYNAINFIVNTAFLYNYIEQVVPRLCQY